MDYSRFSSPHEKIIPPMGLAYLATIAKSLKQDVQLLDAEYQKISVNNLVNNIADFRPDIIAISIPSPLLAIAKRLIQLICRRGIDAKIVVGGIHPTVVGPDIFKEIPAIDIAFIKEAEISFHEYVEGRPLEEIRGIIFRNPDGKLIYTGDPDAVDLDPLPFIDRSLIKNDPWEINGRRESYICSSRGCPFKCTFCSGSLLHGKKIRQRSIKNVVQEIAYLVDNFNVNYIHFVDDNFILNNTRAIEFCNVLTREGRSIGWRFLARASVLHRLHQEEFHMLRVAGCDLIGLGIESGSMRICERIKKGIKLEWIKDIVKKAKTAGILTKGFFIIGYPFEEENDIELTRGFIMESGLDQITISILRVFPGTELYDELLKTISSADLSDYLQHTGLFADDDYDIERIRKAELYMLSHYVNLNPKFSIEDLAKRITSIYREFYVNQ